MTLSDKLEDQNGNDMDIVKMKTIMIYKHLSGVTLDIKGPKRRSQIRRNNKSEKLPDIFVYLKIIDKKDTKFWG